MVNHIILKWFRIGLVLATLLVTITTVAPVVGQTDTPAGLTIPYSGQLTGDDGKLVTGGLYDFTFTVYDAAEGGNLVWSEAQAGVSVQEGVFTVILGSVNPLPDSAKNGELWLEVSVRGPQDTAAAILSPRQLLGAASSTALKTTAGTCAHTHFGESWLGSNGAYGLMVTNTSATTGDGIRGYTSASGINWAGLFGVNSNTGAGGPGTYGYSAKQAGIFGSAKASTVLTYLPGGPVGVYGIGPNGVFGYASGTGAGDGVVGTTTATNMSGVYGYATNSFGVTGRSTNNFGVQAVGGGDALASDAVGDLLLGGERGEIITMGTNSRLNLQSDWNVNFDIDRNNNQTDATFDIWANGSTVAPIFKVDESGNTWATGVKHAVVKTADYGQRSLNSIESPDVWFEDLGTGVLANGVVTVTIEAMFAETVDLSDYHVLVTPVCEEPAVLYVTSKTPTGFTVKGVTLDGQPSACSFDYRISAKRLGYEDVRMQAPVQSDAAH